jgi:hypothetical protein
VKLLSSTNKIRLTSLAREVLFEGYSNWTVQNNTEKQNLKKPKQISSQLSCTT